ncbi:MAG: hypothetical protein JWN18_413 [Parcubacteria group bacterium]|nr:hypothetical protein [Parcubacteria group bacterium]
MAKDVSAAEQSGLSFKERCTHAKEYVEAQWTFIQNNATIALMGQQANATDSVEHERQQERRLAEIADADLRQDLRESFGELSSRMEKFYSKLKEADRELMQKLWSLTIESCKSLYGEDATAVALNQTNRARQGN